LTVAIAIELEGIKVNAVSPGFTRTNLNGYAGTETVEEGAREAVRVKLLGRHPSCLSPRKDGSGTVQNARRFTSQLHRQRAAVEVARANLVCWWQAE
jgi:NAD(P)-dependent dehydrogenase (short-subunit alcohol dehydrogenase family)